MTTTDRLTYSLVFGYLCAGAAGGVGLGALALQLHRLGFASVWAAAPTRMQLILGLMVALMAAALAGFFDHEEVGRRSGVDR